MKFLAFFFSLHSPILMRRKKWENGCVVIRFLVGLTQKSSFATPKMGLEGSK